MILSAVAAKLKQRVDFLLAANRVGTDGAGTYPLAIAESLKEGLLPRTPLHCVTKHLQQGIESDQFRVKRAMPCMDGFRSFYTVLRTIQGFEAMLWLRKGFGFVGQLPLCAHPSPLREEIRYRRTCSLPSRMMHERWPVW